MTPNKTSIRLLLVDDHALFRQGLGRLLEAEEDFDLLEDVDSVAAAIAALERSGVDIVLLDFDLGQETGLDLLKLLRQKAFGGAVLIVTAGLSPSDTLRVLALGAVGIFHKHRSPADLTLAIRTIAAGAPWIDDASRHTLLAGPSSASPGESKSTTLSARERSVLQAVFEGLGNKEIGARLGISEAYVKALMQQLFSKTGVRSRGQLVRVALERQHLDSASFATSPLKEATPIAPEAEHTLGRPWPSRPGR